MSAAAERAAAAASDVRWPLRVLFAALAAGLVAGLSLAFTPSAWQASPGPLSGPHARAGIPCSRCHAARTSTSVAAGACVGCHGEHPSTRAAHRVLQRQLGCPGCHAVHGASPAVAVQDGSVPRVPLAVCGRCHDLVRRDDPVQACVGSGAWSGFAVCLDEHQTPAAPLAARGACAREHGAARFVAWDEARLASGPAQAAARAGVFSPSRWLPLVAGGAAGALALAMSGMRRRKGRARPAPSAGQALAPPERTRLPRINATSCLGCQACVDACPFDALAVERHVAVLARPDACCGVGACERACPNGSLRLVDQGEPVADRPRVDAHLESLDRPGIFVVGDLTGIPLIRNAIAQGVAAADRIALGRKPRDARGGPGALDVAVVGSGPAGLACALRARELGLSCVVLEQSELAASIGAFPRAKIIHDVPLELPVEGPLWLRECTKEELVAHWTRLVRTHRLDVRVRHRVVGIRPEGEGFIVSAEGPEGPRDLEAARVVLATGRRGTPRPLDAEIAPEAASRVLHALSDARAWGGKSVLVVGLGDAAMEAVVALARQESTQVTVSYRGTEFLRGSARNIAAVRRLAESGRVRIRWGTRVSRVDSQTVTLEGPEGPETMPVDVVLALLGGEPARALLSAAGIVLSPR